ncbi:SAM-dependent methyltransferase [Nucisporomicrobium flavum]|uniref:SAM-dependent methyltransferase n=1 Tax=Nucisporomicrobium flavum TaxID=2785915 RepID=UPI0018F40D23|nr:methyltransferase domain-containing protein [Nucisporomicrobium flavum]
MTAAITHERAVRAFYDDSPGGEGAGRAYLTLMGDVWHHGDAAVEQAGGSPRDAALAMQRRLMALAGVAAGERVLDFGSGLGGATCEMARATGATFVGVSNTETLNEHARALAHERGLSRQTSFVTVGDLDYRTLLAWPDGSFDAVVFLESVCHLSDKPAFFRAVFRLLKPGGRLVGLDWLQRAYGDHQTPEQIDHFIRPVCEHIRLAGLGTLDSYADMMADAGFTVTHAEDEFAGRPCWGSTPAQDREAWLTYSDLFRKGKCALDAAREAGVFTVGWWAATRPSA